MAGVQEDPKERIAEMAIDDLLKHSADLADVQCFVPRDYGLEVRSNQPLDVVMDLDWQLTSVLDNETSAAVEGAPNAESCREPVPALDATITRAQQAERRTGPRSSASGGKRAEHHSTREDEPPRLLALPGWRAEHQVSNSARGVARGVLEGGELLHFVDHSEPLLSAGEDVTGVLDKAAIEYRCTYFVDDERGHIDSRSIGKLLPADHPAPDRRS